MGKPIDIRRVCTYIACVCTFVKDRRVQPFYVSLGRASRTRAAHVRAMLGAVIASDFTTKLND